MDIDLAAIVVGKSLMAGAIGVTLIVAAVVGLFRAPINAREITKRILEMRSPLFPKMSFERQYQKQLLLIRLAGVMVIIVGGLILGTSLVGGL